MLRVVLVFTSLFLCTSLGAIHTRQRPLPDGRIVGGSPANILNFPYQLSLEYKNMETQHFEHFCGAIVISEFWAISAVHCVYRRATAKFRLRAGTSYKETGGELYEISEIIAHPEYNQENFDYDIALIKVANPFNYSDAIQPANLPQATPSTGTVVVVSGWGSISFGGGASEQLLKVTIRVIDHDKCNASYQVMGGITSRMLCAGVPELGKDTCGGDSGGPLVAAGNQLVGVVSWGLGCGDRHYPGVYADVAYFRSWIISNTGINLEVNISV